MNPEPYAAADCCPDRLVYINTDINMPAKDKMLLFAKLPIQVPCTVRPCYEYTPACLPPHSPGAHTPGMTGPRLPWWLGGCWSRRWGGRKGDLQGVSIRWVKCMSYSVMHLSSTFPSSRIQAYRMQRQVSLISPVCLYSTLYTERPERTRGGPYSYLQLGSLIPPPLTVTLCLGQP
jgi:hypothetical protein